MKYIAQIKKSAKTLPVTLTITICVLAQQPQTNRQSAAPARATLLRAFVIDDRLSALRREPGLQSEVLRRVHLGRPVFIIRSSSKGRFVRVAVSRRTRGWIHESALAVQGRAGEDQRVMKLIESNADKTNTDVLDRITLCRTLIEHFPASRLTPRALLHIGEEADRAADSLSQRARKRLAEAVHEESNASTRDYYLSDAGLDRYSRLRILFDFNESTGEYVYDGAAYREIVKRFPRTEEAKIAEKKLEAIKQKMEQRK